MSFEAQVGFVASKMRDSPGDNLRLHLAVTGHDTAQV